MIAHADASGAIISASITPGNPLEGGNLTGSCSAENVANVVKLQYQWQRNSTLNASGEMLFGNSIAAGQQHTCAIRANDSRILCWGGNYYGQLGDGTQVDRYNPTQINNTSNFTSISAGKFHTCAIRSNDSRVLCWGSNNYGQLGNGASGGGGYGAEKHNPTLINDTSNFTSISAGGEYTCAIRANDSRVLCWGRNTNGQLGDGTTTHRNNPTPINDTSNFTSIISSSYSEYSHTCAIRANDSRVLCWGSNNAGQLGDGTTSDKYNPNQINDTAAFASITSGAAFTCTIRANDSRVLCWGSNGAGQLGDGTTSDKYNPNQINDTAAFASITAGDSHVCAIRANDSRVLCWGSNYYGQLEDGTTSNKYVPTVISDASLYASIKAGNSHTCAIRVIDSRVLCWGYNGNGQLGDGNTMQRNNPSQTSSTDAFASISTGPDYTCAIRANDSRVLCWGYNGDGQLGDGSLSNKYDPVLINDTSNFTSISASRYSHTCAIRANDSRVLCWGRNTYGQLGDGTTTHRYNPTPINDTSNFTSVSTGDSHTCAIRANDSRVLCWGTNSYGQITDWNGGRLSPTVIIDTAAFSSVSAGDSHTCAIRANDSRVLCWGYNWNGQLGDGTTTDKRIPTPINSTANFTSIKAGSSHTCAIRSNDSRVLCWGYNGDGRLGDGTTTQRKSPTPINDTSNFTSVSPGSAHTCAIRSNDSRVLCWGYNGDGQLGDGTTTQRNSPTPINDTSNFSSISVDGSSGYAHTCAIRSNDSRVLCWGSNNNGQLGLGIIVTISDPSAFYAFFSGRLYSLSTLTIASPSRGDSWLFSCLAATASGSSDWANTSATVSAPATGNASSINATGVSNLTVQINGISNISGTGFGQNATVNVSSGEGVILSFHYNFTTTELNLSAISIENGTDGKAYAFISGINSSALVGTKTIFIYNANTSYSHVCIKDEEGAAYSDISSDCTGSNEHILACDGTEQSGYTCTLDNTTLTVAGLQHSAVTQFAPIVYLPQLSGGSSYAAPSLAYSFNCSSGTLAITAKSGGEPIGGLEVRLKDPAQLGWLSSAATDSQGMASFAITKSMRYSAETVQASGYSQAYLEPFQLTLCQSGQQQSPANGTQSPSLAQPPAASQPPAAVQQPAPSVPVPQQTDSSPPSQITGNDAEKTAPEDASLPRKAINNAVDALPASDSAKDAMKEAAPPAISLAMIGIGMVFVLAAVAGYIFFIRKKKGGS